MSRLTHSSELFGVLVKDPVVANKTNNMETVTIRKILAARHLGTFVLGSIYGQCILLSGVFARCRSVPIIART